MFMPIYFLVHKFCLDESVVPVHLAQYQMIE